MSISRTKGLINTTEAESYLRNTAATFLITKFFALYGTRGLITAAGLFWVWRIESSCFHFGRLGFPGGFLPSGSAAIILYSLFKPRLLLHIRLHVCIYPSPVFLGILLLWVVNISCITYCKHTLFCVAERMCQIRSPEQWALLCARNESEKSDASPMRSDWRIMRKCSPGYHCIGTVQQAR